MINKDEKLLVEAYENIMQQQYNKPKEMFYKNIMNKFMNESTHKHVQGFQPWLDSQILDGKPWTNDQQYQKMHRDLEKQTLIPSNISEFCKEINEFVLNNIGSDDRAWSVEA